MRALLFIILSFICLVSCNNNSFFKETISKNVKIEDKKIVFYKKDTISERDKLKDTLTYQESMKNLKTIFENYKTNNESIESIENKNTMTKSLNSLKSVTNRKDLELLINIWNYYDPTDFSCRNEIFNILLKNRTISIHAVKERMKNKLSWENDDFSNTEFKSLLEQLENEK